MLLFNGQVSSVQSVAWRASGARVWQNPVSVYYPECGLTVGSVAPKMETHDARILAR